MDIIIFSNKKIILQIIEKTKLNVNWYLVLVLGITGMNSNTHFLEWVLSFFQLVCGRSIPTDDKILLRIIKECDLQARDREGHTILHKVVVHEQPVSRMTILLQNGANIAARDLSGRNTRDLAVKMGLNTYKQCIDDFIIKLVKDKKFNDVEKLVLQSYDGLSSVTDSSGKGLVEIAKKSSSRQIYEIVNLSSAIQVRFTTYNV